VQMASNLPSRSARQAYDYVLSEGQPQYYQEFIQMYPHDPLCDRIRWLLANLLVANAWHKTVLANSPIACAVRQGAAKPDISTVDGLRQAFLNASHVAYSDSASGEYIKRQLLEKLGIKQAMEGKAAQIPATPVGEIIAQGEADFGCQQRSELQPVKGIDIVGTLPEEVQLRTQFAGALVRGASHPEAARQLLRFLSSPANAPAIEATGLEPVAAQH